jgi:hypothetical protein
MPGEYSLSDLLERIYHNQLALEAAVMELTLSVEEQGLTEIGGNVRGALETIGENARLNSPPFDFQGAGAEVTKNLLSVGKK